MAAPAPTAAYKDALLALQAQQRARLSVLVQQTEAMLHSDWQRGMGAASALYRPVLDEYAKALSALRIANDDPAAKLSLDWLTSQNNALKSIEQSVRASALKYGDASVKTVEDAQLKAMTSGLLDAENLTQEALWPASQVGLDPALLFNRPNPDAIAQMVGRAGNGHPIGDLFANFPQEATSGARQALLMGLATGANPVHIASGIQQAMGVSRSRAITIARTEVLGSYRAAAHETYRANSDVLGYWLWSAGGNNPCFPAGALIETLRGPMPIEDVHVGDAVLTHRGRYRRVTRTMIREYLGGMVTLQAGGRIVTATASHPFLVQRQGKLDWIEAGQLRLSDRMVSQCQSSAQIFNHGERESAVEGRVGQTDDTIPLRLQQQRLAGVTFDGARLAMPVEAVNLEHDVERGQIEVNGRWPALHRVFLPELDAQLLEAETRTAFRFRLARMATVAARRAKATTRNLTRLGTHFLATLEAGEGMRRASAFLRAVMSPRRNTRNLAAAGAGSQVIMVDDWPTAHAGSRAVHLLASAQLGAEGLATRDANALHAMRSNVADSGTILTVTPPMVGAERRAAMLTGAFDGRVRDLAALGMRVRLLMQRITRARAVAPLAALHMRRRATEGRAAVLTDAFHIHTITRIAPHIQIAGLLVYNLEVEDDQSYVADGFAVHNCAMCAGMDGTLHDLSEDLSDHSCGKCAPIPVTKPWDEILGPYGIDASDLDETSIGAPGSYRSISEKFDSYSPAKQREIIGTQTGYEAYKRGEVTLKDFIGVRPAADGFPSSYYQKSLKELQIPTRQAARLVQPSPEIMEKLANGTLRYTDLGKVTPDALMPAWAKSSESSRIVYQILRNGLPYDMTAHERGLLVTNLTQMLGETLPTNVRAAVERQLEALGQSVERLTLKGTRLGTLRDPLQVTLDRIESQIVNESFEHAYVLREDGAILFDEVSASRHEVGFTQAQLDEMSGNIITHNHPDFVTEPGFSAGSPSPSNADIRLFYQNALAELRVVTPEWRISIKPPEGGWNKVSLEAILARKRTFAKVFVDEVMPDVRTGRLTLKEAEDEVWQRVWTRIAERTGLQYERIAWDAQAVGKATDLDTLAGARAEVRDAKRALAAAQDAVRADFSRNPQGLLSSALERDGRVLRAKARLDAARARVAELARASQRAFAPARASVSDAEAAARAEVKVARSAVNSLNRKLNKALEAGKDTKTIERDIQDAKAVLEKAQGKLDTQVAIRKTQEAAAKAAVKAQQVAEKAAAREAAKVAKAAERQAARDAAKATKLAEKQAAHEVVNREVSGTAYNLELREASAVQREQRDLLRTLSPTGKGAERVAQAEARIARELSARLKDSADFQQLAPLLRDRLSQIVRDTKGITAEAKQREIAHIEAQFSDKKIVQALMGEWARQYTPLWASLQEAIGSEFELSAARETLASPVGKSALRMADKYLGDLQPGLRALVREMYNNTQDFLAKEGITEVPVYRGLYFNKLPDGISWKTLKNDYQVITIRMNPASSFSLDAEKASAFAGGGRYQVVIAARVPAQDILSIPLTGAGVRDEAEVIVLGSQQDVWAIGRAAGADMTRADVQALLTTDHADISGASPLAEIVPGDIARATARATDALSELHIGSYDLTPEDRAFVADLKQQIDRLDHANLTHADVIDIGKAINQRIMNDPTLADLHDASAAKIAMRETPMAQWTDAQRAWFNGEPSADAAHGGLGYFEAQGQYQAEYQARVLAYLQETRDLGGAPLEFDFDARGFNMEVSRAVAQTRDWLPTEWINASNDLGKLTTVLNRDATAAGWFDANANGAGKIGLSTFRGDMDVDIKSAALHEMMHRMEQVFPQISQLEQAFYDSRTVGDIAVDLTNNVIGKTKLDDFVDQYLGRTPLIMRRPGYMSPLGFERGSVESYELLSLGAEMLLGGGGTYDLVALREDEEFVHFILGLFSTIRRTEGAALP